MSIQRYANVSERFPVQMYARTGGIVYLYIVVAALFAEIYVRGSLIVPGDPTTTASNILGSETLFRLGLAGEMLTCICDVTLALILYVLLKPINRHLALLGAFFRLAFISIYGATKLFEIAALVFLRRADNLTGIEPAQAHDLAYVSLSVHSYGYGASLLLFGCCCIIFGYLIQKSTFLPRILGSLLLISGAGYVIFSVTQMVAPSFAGKYLFPWIMLPAFFAELGLALWLLVKGVNVEKWETVTNRMNED